MDRTHSEDPKKNVAKKKYTKKQKSQYPTGSNKNMYFSDETFINWCREDPETGLYAAGAIRGFTANSVEEQVERTRLSLSQGRSQQLG